jgi:hypothetical protein
MSTSMFLQKIKTITWDNFSYYYIHICIYIYIYIYILNIICWYLLSAWKQDNIMFISSRSLLLWPLMAPKAQRISCPSGTLLHPRIHGSRPWNNFVQREGCGTTNAHGKSISTIRRHAFASCLLFALLCQRYSQHLLSCLFHITDKANRS